MFDLPPSRRADRSFRGRMLAAILVTAAVTGGGQVASAAAAPVGLLVAGPDSLASAWPVTILADPGPFASVQEAAISEGRVNWRGDDRRASAAVTGCFAATEFRHFLAARMRVPDSALALSDEQRLPGSGRVFLFTSDPRDPRLAGLDTSGAPPLPGGEGEGFRIFTVSEPGRVTSVVQGAQAVGTLHGAYALLERFGVRFYGLGEAGTVYLARGAGLPGNLRFAEQPAYLTRGFWAFEPRGNRDLFLWMARNRLNLWTALEPDAAFLHKLGIRLTSGGHVIQQLFLDPAADYPYRHARLAASRQTEPDPYPVGADCVGDRDYDGRLSNFEAHPDWYGRVGGKRSDHIAGDEGDNFCTSNPDAVRELTRNLLRALETGGWRDTDILVFWMLDNGRWCECDRCRAIGTPTDRLFRLLEAVRDSLRGAEASGALGRPVLLESLAFLETMSPPARPLPAGFDAPDFALTYFPIYRCYAHALADSACTEINQAQERDYERWAGDPARFYKGAIAVGEYYNVSSLHSLPIPYTRVLRADVPWYYRHGARHFDYMHVMTRRWGVWTLNHALLARLLWDPNADADRILDEFYAAYYPATHESTRRCFEALERATANFKPLLHRVMARGRIYGLAIAMGREGDPLTLEHLHYDSGHSAKNDAPGMADMKAGMRAARTALDHALTECPAGAERVRLLEDDHQLRYAEAMLDFLDHMVRLTRAERVGTSDDPRREWRALDAAARRLKGMVDVVRVSSRDTNARDGLAATEMQDLYEAYAAKYTGAPRPRARDASLARPPDPR